MPSESVVPTFADVRAAAERIRGIVRHTPALPYEALAERIGAAEVWLKCENLQVAGAFKSRGANNALLSLDEAAKRRGVVTHSSGNHGAALAYAAWRLKIPCRVVVPENCSPVKLAAIQRYADVKLCAPTLLAREAAVEEIITETGATLVHPYDDDRVIAGQGTAALELLADVPQLDTLVIGVSGGGLIGGCSLAAHGINPAIEIFGAEPELASDAWQSLHTGKLSPPLATTSQTIADGLRASLSPRTFALLQAHVRDVLTISEPQMIAAMREAWEHTKLLIEPSSAVPLAAIAAHATQCKGRRIGVIVSGGNVSLDRLPWQ